MSHATAIPQLPESIAYLTGAGTARRKRERLCKTCLVLLFLVIAATGFPLAAQQSAPGFDVASIKRNIGPMPRTSGKISNTPKGEIRLAWIPARLLVLLA